MPITLDEIIEETRSWPPEKVGQLVGRLRDELHSMDSEVEAAWDAEIAKRIEQINSGKVEGTPADEVFAQARRILKA